MFALLFRLWIKGPGVERYEFASEAANSVISEQTLTVQEGKLFLTQLSPLGYHCTGASFIRYIYRKTAVYKDHFWAVPGMFSYEKEHRFQQLKSSSLKMISFH